MISTEDMLKQQCAHAFHEFEMKDNCELSDHKNYVILDNHYMLEGFTDTIRILLAAHLRSSFNGIFQLSFLYLIAYYSIRQEMYMCVMVLLYSFLNPRSMSQGLKVVHRSIKVVMIIVNITTRSKVTNE